MITKALGPIILILPAIAADQRRVLREKADQEPPEPLKCRGVSTGEVLGYDIDTNEPVYREFCSGVCPQTKDPFTCRAEYKYEKLRTYPVWTDLEIGSTGEASLPPELPVGIPAFKTVKLIDKCTCAPKPCLINNDSTIIPHGETAYNECGERCTCRFGFLANCCRIRKSIVHMPKAERERFVDAHRGISSGDYGAALKDEYDALIKDHYDYWNSDIHFEEWFLPWHRHYLLLFENILRKVDCRITVPYWAMELDHADPWNSPLWNGSPYWYGGGSGGGCVPDGAFQYPWTTTPSDGEGCLRRDRVGGVPSPVDVALLLSTLPSDFMAFHTTLDPVMHGGVHCSIDGTMCSPPRHSANAPEFFLVHSWVDRTWDKWQSQSAAHASAYTASYPPFMSPGSLAEGHVLDFINSAAQTSGGDICIIYEDPKFIAITDVIGTLSKMPRQMLLTVPSSSPAALIDGGRQWVRAVHGTDQSDIESSVLADWRGRATSAQHPSSLPLGATVDDLRAALWDLKGPDNSPIDLIGKQKIKDEDIDSALRALEEYESQLGLDREQCGG